MKLLLLHGLAKISSRKKLIDLKQEFDQNNVVVFEEGADIPDLLASLVSLPLLQDQRLIVLENPPEEIDISSLDESISLVLWFDHQVPDKKPVIESVKKLKGQILFFPEERETSVFPFLDYLVVGEHKAHLEIEKLKAAGFDVHYLITMVYYLLRNLAATPKNAPTFVKEKLQRQRKNFTLDRITTLYREVMEIDFKIKSGLLEKDQAEFLLVNLF